MFSTHSDNFISIFDITSLFAAEFEEPEIGLSGKELIRGIVKPNIVTKFHVYWTESAASMVQTDGGS